jgi:aryl-alcohol dehydrogenase-like predicted oxidoreductase
MSSLSSRSAGNVEIEEAQKVAEVVSVQNLYNLADRHHEAVLAYATEQDMAFIPWFPSATGREPGQRARSGGEGRLLARTAGADLVASPSPG